MKTKTKEKSGIESSTNSSKKPTPWKKLPVTRATVYEDLDKLIYEEAKVTNSPHQFNQLFSKVFDFIISKVNDINDWPEACMYNLNDKVVLVELAEL